MQFDIFIEFKKERKKERKKHELLYNFCNKNNSVKN